MVRAKFAGRPGDSIVSLFSLGRRQVLALPADANGDPTAITLTVWDAPDGTQLTDLLAADGSTAIEEVVVPVGGQIPEFFGPDGVLEVYLRDPEGDFTRIDVGPQGPAGVADDPSMAAIAADEGSAFRGVLSATIATQVQADVDDPTGVIPTAIDAALGDVDSSTTVAIASAAAAVDAAANTVPLILAIGESNSGGQARNSALAAGDLAARAALKIFNNTSLVFESLDIGTNNLDGHSGLDGVDDPEDGGSLTLDQTRHGWENGLAASAEAGIWDGQVYLVKAGQGGSKVQDWGDGTGNWSAFTARFDAAVAAIRALGKEPQVYIWASIGINNHISNTTVPTFRAGLITWLSRIRTHVMGQVPNFLPPVFFTRLPVNYNTYNTGAIDDLDQDVDLFFPFLTDDGGKDDVAHWNAIEMKRQAIVMAGLATSTIGQAGRYAATAYRPPVQQEVKEFLSVTWTSASAGSTVTGGTLATDAGNKGALGGTVDATQPFELEIYYADQAGSDAFVFILDDDNTANFTWSGQSFVTGCYHLSGVMYRVHSAVGETSMGAFSTFPARVRVRKSGDDVIYSKSTNGGVTFTDIHTDTGVLAGKTTLYVKASAASGPGTFRVLKRVY
jgi:hypothetical protein